MKQIKKILSVFLAVITLLLVVPFHALDFSFAADETPKEMYDLIPYNFNSEPNLTKTIYNISKENISDFTPFDFETKRRMAGTSFALDVNENNEIINEYVNLLNARVTYTEGKDYALYMWVYLGEYEIHDLKVTLQFQTAQIYWDIPQQSFLSENENGGTISLPRGWNLMRLPLAEANKEDDLYKEQTPTKMIIDYQSERIANEKFSALRFYHVYIGETGKGDELFEVKNQDYAIASFNGYDEKIRDNLVVGDEVTIKSIESVIEYAWEGEIDLTNGRLFNNTQTAKPYSWIVELRTPSDDTSKRVYEGNKIKFEEAGTYILSYQCRDINNNIIVSFSQPFSARVFTPIFIKNSAQSNKYKMKINTTYRIEFATSQVFESVGDLSFSVISGDIEINDLGNGILEVTAHSAGNFKIEAKVDGTRIAKPELATYRTEIDIEVVKENKSSNWVFIFIYCVIGFFGVILVGFVIYSLVKARKFDVK